MAASKRILIIDDDRFVAESLRGAIVATIRPAVEVDVSLNGSDGFNATTFTHYGLVIMDLRMPHLNGVDAIGMIRMIQPLVPIIIYSGCLEEYADELRELEVYAILKKPTPVRKIAETIESLFSGPTPPGNIIPDNGDGIGTTP